MDRPSDAGGLVGRDRELAVLDQVIEGLAGRGPRVAVVVGEAGMGKTALVRAAVSRHRATVVWATADEGEREVDQGVVDQLARRAPLADADRDEVVGSLGADPIRVGEAMVRVVDRLPLAADRPLVVVVDDAQWADDGSLRALAFASRRLRRDPVLLCLVLRPEGVRTLPEGLRRMAEDEGVRVDVAPLGREPMRAIASAHLGEPVSAAAADRLVQHTAGSPLHLRTLLGELDAATLLGSAPLPSPRSFSTLVLARLAAAGVAVEEVVAAVAVAGDGLPVRTVAAIVQRPDLEVCIDAAVHLGFLAAVHDPIEGPVVQIGHPLVRAAVVHDLPPARRAELHRRAGRELPGLSGLRHRLQGSLGPDLELWDEARRAAEAEAVAGAHGSAAGILRAARAVAPDPASRDEVLLRAVDELLLAGRLAEAGELRPAVEEMAASAQRGYVLGRLAYVLGPRRTARDELAAAWAAVGPQPGPEQTALAGRIAAMLATLAVDRARGEEALDWCRRALALDPQHAAVASATHMLAGAWALLGRFAEGLSELDARCAELERRGAGGAELADAHSGRALLRLWTHDLPGAAADLERCLGELADHGPFVARETARAYLAEVCYRRGDWDRAVLLADVASSLVDDTDQAWMAALPHAIAARLRAARGEDAQHHLDRARAAAALVGGVAVALTDVAALEAAACRRDADLVLEVGASLHGERRGVDDRIAPWRAAYVEALSAAGRVGEAEEVLEELEALATSPLVQGELARAACALAAARGDVEQAAAQAATGLALGPEVVGPYPYARLELAAGSLWRRRGERRRAAEVLEPALERFRALGASPWAALAEREVAALGLRPSRDRARPGAELTPQEGAIARLVAGGLTNREVAAELVISAKTVEHHLSRVYAKLGVRSRTELARVLAPGAPTP